jgi:hypothetical protein
MDGIHFSEVLLVSMLLYDRYPPLVFRKVVLGNIVVIENAVSNLIFNKLMVTQLLQVVASPVDDDDPDYREAWVKIALDGNCVNGLDLKLQAHPTLWNRE